MARGQQCVPAGEKYPLIQGSWPLRAPCIPLFIGEVGDRVFEDIRDALQGEGIDAVPRMFDF